MPLIQGIHNGRAAIVTVRIVEAAKYVEHKQSDNPVLPGGMPFRARVARALSLQQVNMIQLSWRNNLATRLPFSRRFFRNASIHSNRDQQGSCPQEGDQRG
jgi:hypothetical protein